MANDSFFDNLYQTPTWLEKKLSRRHLLKSAAGATAMVGLSSLTSAASSHSHNGFKQTLATDPWMTLNAVFDHILPASASGPSAQDIQATFYLYQLVHQQPTPEDEIAFIYQGVGWLNGFTQNQYQKNFIALTKDEKDNTFTAISRSQAGDNWLNMMILNLYEAMLAPPSYGGNPDGIGWKWIAHQAGFPLPEAGQRYYELPERSRVSGQTARIIKSVDVLANQPSVTAMNNDVYKTLIQDHKKGKTKA